MNCGVYEEVSSHIQTVQGRCQWRVCVKKPLLAGKFLQLANFCLKTIPKLATFHEIDNLGLTTPDCIRKIFKEIGRLGFNTFLSQMTQNRL